MIKNKFGRREGVARIVSNFHFQFESYEFKSSREQKGGNSGGGQKKRISLAGIGINS